MLPSSSRPFIDDAVGEGKGAMNSVFESKVYVVRRTVGEKSAIQEKDFGYDLYPSP
jgi:hypothetical protein